VVDAVTTGITIGGVFFDGGATATLATGLAAVAGAFVIGWRQSSISKRQNAILEKQAEGQDASDRRQAENATEQTKIMALQTEIQHLNARIAIFEKRYGVHKAFQRFSEYFQPYKVPNSISEEEWAKLMKEMDDQFELVQYLFGDDIYEKVLTFAAEDINPIAAMNGSYDSWASWPENLKKEYHKEAKKVRSNLADITRMMSKEMRMTLK